MALHWCDLLFSSKLMDAQAVWQYLCDISSKVALVLGRKSSSKKVGDSYQHSDGHYYEGIAFLCGGKACASEIMGFDSLVSANVCGGLRSSGRLNVAAIFARNAST